MRENARHRSSDAPGLVSAQRLRRRLRATHNISISVMAISLFIAASAYPARATGLFDEIKANWQPSDTLILDRHGETLHRLRTDSLVRRGQWVTVADVSPALRTALVLSEDKRFYAHSGVDWQAVSAAAWANLFNRQTRGASTLTMQLAGLLDDDLKRGAGGRSLLQKVQQTVTAEWLEQRLRKDQILEAYLNLVPFRGELVGIDALSQTLFGKAAHGLDAREAAIAAALVRAPNAKPALVAQRACGVLKDMQEGATTGARGKVKPASAPAAGSSDDCAALDFFTTATLQRRDYPASFGMAPHLAQQVTAAYRSQPANLATAATAASPAGPVRPLPAAIRTTLHAPLQRFAVQTLQQHLRELRGRQVEDGALVVLDNASGEVLAWVGSSGQLSRAAEVDGVTALRQPGSTLKPFLYAQAIAERRLTAASLLADSSAQIQTGAGLYIPQNYDRQFKGWVSARTALGASLNVPAVRTLVMLSPDAFHRQLVQLGLPLKESGDYYGYSLALGSAEVSLLALANAYRTLANGGRSSPTRLLPVAAAANRQGLPASPNPAMTSAACPSPNLANFSNLANRAPKGAGADPASQPARYDTAPRWGQAAIGAGCFAQVLDARAAFIVGDILSDRLARAPTFGSDSVLATRFWSAVKTGTSKDMRDNWALGYSQAYTVGVWVGNASGAPMWDVSGSSGAAPVWAALMQFLHARRPSQSPRPPSGLVHTDVSFAANGHMPGIEAARQEWFLQGTEQPVFAIESIAGSTGGIRAGGQKSLNLSNQQPGPAQPRVRITEPAHGSIIALDPDIPPQHQRVRFEAVGQNLRWRIDDRPFASGPSALWLPWPGRHRVQLADARGRVLDEVQLEVRGAGLKETRRPPR